MILKPGGVVAERYRLDVPLGTGGFGSVWRASDRRLGDGKLLAIKFLHDDPDLPEDAAVRFRQEARILGRLSHPGIPKVHDIAIDDGVTPYFTFEYVDGATLLNVINGGISLFEGLRHAISLMDILAAIHEAGVLHRDLKPENLLVERATGQLKLIDFGISKSETQALVKTRTGVILGTVRYMPPEQMATGEYTRASDLYSAGLVVYELLSGCPAFPPDLDYLGLLKLKQAGQVEPLSDLVAHLPPAVDRAILSALSPDPHDRPKSAAQLRDELTRLLTLMEDRAAGVKPVRTQEHHVPGVAPATAEHRVSRRVRTVVGAATGRVTRPVKVMSGGAARRSAVGVGAAVMVVVGVVALALLAAKRGPSSAPAVTPRLSPSVSPSVCGGAGQPDVAQLARALRTALGEAKPPLDLRWLKEFAAVHRQGLKREHQKVSAAIAEHFERIGVLEPLGKFLAHSAAYFGDARIDEKERWRTRSMLCDVELVEYFCEEHHVPWPLAAKPSTSAGSWDESGLPWKLDLRLAPTWMRWQDHLTGARIFEPITDRWKVGRPGLGGRCLLWFGALDWRPGLLIEARVNGGFRRILRFRPTFEPLPPVPIFAAECRGDRAVLRDTPLSVLPHPSWDGKRAYLAAWFPAGLVGPEVEVRTAVIDLPQSAMTAAEPSLRDRILTVLPGSPAGVDPRDRRRSPRLPP